MHLTIDEQETAELQLAVADRVELLKKLRKQTLNRGLSTRDIDLHLKVLNGGDGEAGLVRKLDDQVDAFEGNGRPPREQITIAEALEGSEEEAASRVRERERREALSDVLGPGPGELTPDEAADDNRIAGCIAQAFDNVAWDVDDEEIDYLHHHTTEAGGTIWCFVRGGASPAFWYDIDSQAVAERTFDPAGIAPTFQGRPLFDLARECWGFAVERVAETPDEPLPEVEAESESIGEYVSRVKPAPEVGDITGAVMLALYQALFADDVAQETVQAHDQGLADDELLDTISHALRTYSPHGRNYSFNVQIGTEEAAQFIEIAVQIQPPRLTTGKGRKKQVLEGEQLVAAARAAFEIPEPGEEGVEEETVEAGVAAD